MTKLAEIRERHVPRGSGESGRTCDDLAYLLDLVAMAHNWLYDHGMHERTCPLYRSFVSVRCNCGFSDLLEETR